MKRSAFGISGAAGANIDIQGHPLYCMGASFLFSMKVNIDFWRHNHEPAFSDHAHDAGKP